MCYVQVLILFATLLSAARADTCTVSRYEDVESAAKQCDLLTIGDVIIPEKTTLNIPLKTGAKLVFDGHLTHEPVDWLGDNWLVFISGKDVEVTGTSGHLLDGVGPKHWKGSNEPVIARPYFLRMQLEDSVVRDLHIKNCPNHCFTIYNSTNLLVTNITTDNYDGYPGVAGEYFAKNTDGFNVEETVNLRIENSVVINQDDCVVVNSGHDLVIENVYCNGSHGLSFSVKDADVYGVKYLNSRIENAGNAIHVKTHNDGDWTGKIHDILYQNISFKGVTRYAVSIQENYPSGEARANIPITNLTLDNVKGSMSGSISKALQIICAVDGCSDFHFKDVEVSGAKQKNECQEVPSGIDC